MLNMEDNLSYDSDSLTNNAAKKHRSLSTSSSESVDIESTQQRLGDLELDTVKELFQRYDLAEGDNIPCYVCGKHYKSRVCVKKHLWEHSLYWDLFDGLNKQQRVLSIQAAIILSIKSNPSLSALLVTSPASSKKKEKKDNVSKMTSKSPTRKDFVSENRKRKRKQMKHTSVDHESDYKPNFGYVES